MRSRPHVPCPYPCRRPAPRIRHTDNCASHPRRRRHFRRSQGRAVYRLRLDCARFTRVRGIGPPAEALICCTKARSRCTRSRWRSPPAKTPGSTAGNSWRGTSNRCAPSSGRSPLVHRLQAWPRGYAGDFETVEWLCDARNRAQIGTVPWAIEQCSLQSPLAQQHRNKVGLQARAILSTLVREARRPHRLDRLRRLPRPVADPGLRPACARHLRAGRRGRGRAGVRARAARIGSTAAAVRPGPRAARPRPRCGAPAAVPSGGRRRAVRLPARSLGGGDADRRARVARCRAGGCSCRTSPGATRSALDRVPRRLVIDRAR